MLDEDAGQHGYFEGVRVSNELICWNDAKIVNYGEMKQRRTSDDCFLIGKSVPLYEEVGNMVRVLHRPRTSSGLGPLQKCFDGWYWG